MNKHRFLVLLFFLTVNCYRCAGKIAERELLNRIFTNYTKHATPDRPVAVKVAIRVMGINEQEATESFLAIHGYLSLVFAKFSCLPC